MKSANPVIRVRKTGEYLFFYCKAPFIHLIQLEAEENTRKTVMVTKSKDTG